MGRPHVLIAVAQRRPARYELRTRGPAMTPLKPMSSATSDQWTNSSGLTHRSIGWCIGEGRRYWVIVRMSQPSTL